MPTFYNFTDNGLVYSFDDVFVPADLFREGNLFTWGGNGQGQLAVNDGNTRSTPVTTFSGGANWKQVSSKFKTTAAIKIDGTLWTWGAGESGQLGNNSVINRSSPVQTVSTGTNWKQVSAGVYHVASIKSDGTLWLWGFNNCGQLGTNDTITRSSPVQTISTGTNWRQVSYDGGPSCTTVAINDDCIL